MVDLVGPDLKYFSRIIIFAIMAKAVNDNLKPIFFKTVTKIRRDVVSFRYKAKRGSKSKILLKLHQSVAISMPFIGLSIMGQDKGKALVLRPTRPSARRTAGIRIDWPDFPACRSFFSDYLTAEAYLKASGDKRSNMIVEAIAGTHWHAR